VSDKPPPIASTEPVTGQNVEMTFSERDAPSHEGVKELVAYWNERRKSGEFVMGRDVPSRAIARLMKNLVVFEPVDGGRDFRFRLVGAVLNERIGRDITGMLITEVYGEAAVKDFMAALNKALATGRPVFHESRARGVFEDVRTADAVALPMKAPDGVTTWLLNGVFFW
jgi:hypothetical protein